MDMVYGAVVPRPVFLEIQGTVWTWPVDVTVDFDVLIKFSM